MQQQLTLIGEMPACLVSSESVEWYTPKPYIEAARAVMGSIDVDPASNAIANRIVKAAVYYTQETNGFDKKWPGNVFCNPPYGKEGTRSNQAAWSQRLIEQYQAGITSQAVLLVNSKTGDKWFQPLFQFPICFPNHRIDFYRPDGSKSGGSTHSSALVYMGPHVEKFYQVFRQFGVVCQAMHPEDEISLWKGLIA